MSVDWGTAEHEVQRTRTGGPTRSVRSRRPNRSASSVSRVQLLASSVLACALLVACTATTPTFGRDGGASSSGTPGAPPTTEAASVPLREAREGWKVFSDPARLVSFELPETWVVQPIEPDAGLYAPESLHYAVRTPEGTTAAELHSGILTQEPPCPDAERTPYYVIGSEPLQLTETPPESTDIEPRFVVRLITGFRFFGSFGITDQLGGADGLACSLTNTVDGGEVLGRVGFGDLEVLAPKLPANTGPQTVSFGTIGEAEGYYDTAEFATIREVVASLRLAGAP